MVLITFFFQIENHFFGFLENCFTLFIVLHRPNNFFNNLIFFVFLINQIHDFNAI